jgi:hypothetical protein
VEISGICGRLYYIADFGNSLLVSRNYLLVESQNHCPRFFYSNICEDEQSSTIHSVAPAGSKPRQLRGSELGCKLPHKQTTCGCKLYAEPIALLDPFFPIC